MLTPIFYLFIFIVSCQEKSSDFVLKPQQGSVYHFTVQTEEAQSSLSTDSMLTTTRTVEFALQMEKQADSLQTFNLVMKRITITRPETIVVPGKNGGHMVRTTGRLITMDTDSATNKTGENWYRLVPGLIGDTTKIILNKSGDMNHAWGYETIKNRMVAATGDDVRNIAPTIREYVGPDAISDLVKNLFFYLPGKNIQAGDQWVKNIELTQKAPVKYSHNITVQSIEKDTVHLLVQTIVSARLGGGKLIVEGELTGKVAASIGSGMPLSIELTENSVTHTDNYDVKKHRIFRATMHQSPAR